MISRWRWLFIYPLYLSFIYWSNLCKSNLYLRATEFLHTMEIQCSTWSQFSIIQWLVLQSSARIIHASGCFSFSQCLHFGCFAYCDFSPLEDQQWCNARCITLKPHLQIFNFQLLTKSIFWLTILPLMSHAFSVSLISQFIAWCKLATCLDTRTRLLCL